ncbi:hypothetical protein EDD36DRAFT_262805 [Exophiala viscosa]|uniref:Uncharacterized protein n=1 Tax=Exophiala viscosa TaxID=2486360 RepID=A0AAN6IF94_9EURO|nr:hypothetical protein EDD36DRAFT_262805 [Exophiala viscosa]
MCYYNTYFFLGCGHVSYSSKPVARSRCPSLASAAGLATPPTCTDRFNHPLHTFGIDKLCPACKDERDARVDLFTAHIGDDIEGRILTKSAERNERGSDGRRRLLRASTTLAMTMEPPLPEIKESNNRLSVLSRSSEVRKVVDGFRGAVGWDQAGSSFLSPRDVAPSSHVEEIERPPTRLSFLALAAEENIVSQT